MIEAESVLNGDQWIAIAGIVAGVITGVVSAVLAFLAARERRKLERCRKLLSSTEGRLSKAYLAIQGYQHFLEGVAQEKGYVDYTELFHKDIRPGQEKKFVDTEFLQKARIQKALIKLND